MKLAPIISILGFLLLALPALAAQRIMVLGQSVVASEVDFAVDGKSIHSFTVAEPLWLPLARGNSVLVTGTAFLHLSGKISAVLSQGPSSLRWRLRDGRELLLDCGARLGKDFQQISRVASFYESGEYRMGCSLPEPTEILAEGGNSLKVSGAIDFFANGSLEYAEKANGILPMDETELTIRPGSEIAFHQNGKPRFFTPADKSEFATYQGRYGKMVFGQRLSGRAVSTGMFSNGKVEKGILQKEIFLGELKLQLPPGTGLVFENEEDPQLVDIVFAEPMLLRTSGILASFSALHREPEKKRMFLTLSEPMSFFRPDNGKLITAKAGAILGVSDSWEILSVTQ